MGFDSERELREIASELLRERFGSWGSEVIPEFEYGAGRTDLVFLNISDKYWDHRIDRLELNTPITEKHYLQSFLQLHGRGWVTEEYFFSIGAMDRRKKNQALNWLSSNDFVQRNNGKISTAPQLRRHVTTAIAVELKLTKWKDALKQAYRGRSYSEYQYVVIDKDYIEPAERNRSKFEEYNVGLLAVDDAGEVEKVVEPDRSTPHSHLYKWKLNEVSLASTSP
jgi:hypothetical protein